MTARSPSTVAAGPGSGPPVTTIYYDGSCPLCTKEIGYYQKSPGKDRLAFVDVSGDGPAAVAPDLERRAAMRRFHVRRPDGRLVSGTAAFGSVWQQIPGWQVAGRIVQIPGIRHLGDLMYWQYLRFRPGLQAWERAMAEGDKRRQEQREKVAASMTGGHRPPAAPVERPAWAASLVSKQK